MDQPNAITIQLSGGAEPAKAAAGQPAKRVSAFDLVAAQPWAIQPDMLDTIAAIARREGEGVEAVEARMGRPLQNARKVTIRGNVAVVPVTGPVFRYANLMTEVSGATSLEVLAKDFTAAIDDPAVAGIVLDINSPGGQAAGISDFAQMVRAANKPVVAFVDGMAASAAYWIAAAAKEVVISKTGMAGNVGAVLTLDTRKDPARAEIVSSQSPNKRPDPTTDQGRAQFQALVDSLAQVFVEDVAAFRGKTAESVIADFGGGAVMIGEQAVAAGMADRVGTLEDVIAGLAGKKQPPATPTQPKGPAMNLEELRAAHPDLCAALVEEGRAAGLTAGATAERQRILDVESQLLPGHEALIAELKADGKTTGQEAAVKILAAEKQIAANRLASLRAEAPKPVPHAAAPTDEQAVDPDASLPIDERCKAQWEKNESIRAEFGTLAAFTAYEKANAAGRIRALKK